MSQTCEICGGRRRQHFESEWCPKCWAPQIENYPVMDVVRCLDHLEAKGVCDKETRHRVIEYLFEREYFQNHDDCIGYVPEVADEDDDDPPREFHAVFKALHDLAKQAGHPDPHWILRW